jgi:outer membrane immunogenic protein
VGVNAGGDWYGGNGFVGGDNVRSLLPASSIITIPATARTDSGFTAGGLAGYNYQIGSFVFGAETDFNYIDSHSERSGSTSILCCLKLRPAPGFPPTVLVPIRGSGAVETLSLESKSQLDWFGTARARLGFLPTPRLLIYGTGGLGYGEVGRSLENSNVFTANVTSRFWEGSNSEIKVGWNAGGGVEYALTSAVSIRAEYLYLDLGKSSVTANYAGLFPQTAPWTQIYYTSSHDNKFNIARAAVAYKF